MKKLLYLILVIVILFSFTACEKKQAKVAREFLEAMDRHDYDRARELSVKSGHEILDMLESFTEGLSDAALEENANTDFKIIKTVVKGDSATVTYEYWQKAEPDSIDIVELPLVIEDGEWKVDLSKDNVAK
ncbi:MAG TPA: DUF4878 domain-containing protein [Candidatus Cloacimonetes bacterium]|nr:DUF4878 domain-containing protein [Candidatus Cloacimonadota bacterium]